MPEVMITIIILGILAGIAIPSWWSVVESRRVDSATNQLVADLRLAHSKASSRLTVYRVCFPSNSVTYQIGLQTGPGTEPCAVSLETRTLPDGTQTGTAPVTPAAIAFCADGSMEAPPTGTVCPNGTASPSLTGTTTITVGSDGDPSTNIEVNKATSRVKVVP